MYIGGHAGNPAPFLRLDRYALFVLAGLISISQKKVGEEESDDEERILSSRYSGLGGGLRVWGITLTPNNKGMFKV